jgi:outer membrane protein
MANFLPDLSASASGSKNFSSNKLGSALNSSGRPGNQNVESASAGLSSNLNVFNGFGDLANLSGSKLGLRADQADHDFKQQSVVFQTISQFVQAVKNGDFIHIEEENLKAQDQQLQQIEEFYNTGNRSIADVLQQRAAIKQSEMQVLTAKRNYEVSRIDLLQTLGQSSTADLEFAPLKVDSLQSLPDVEFSNAALDTVLRARKDGAGGVLALALTERRRRNQLQQFRPVIRIFRSVQKQPFRNRRIQRRLPAFRTACHPAQCGKGQNPIVKSAIGA